MPLSGGERRSAHAAGAFTRSVAAQRGPCGGAGGEGERLGGVVERERAAAEVGATTARRRGEQLVRLAVVGGPVLWPPGARVPDRGAGSSGSRRRGRAGRGRDPRRTGTARRRRARGAQVAVRAATAAAIAQPTGARRRGAPGVGAVAQRPRQRARMQQRGQQRAAVPGSGWALRWTEPSGLSSRGTCSASSRRAWRASRSITGASWTTISGLSSSVTEPVTAPTPRLLAAPKPTSPASITSAPKARAIWGPSSWEPASTTTSCGAATRARASAAAVAGPRRSRAGR